MLFDFFVSATQAMKGRMFIVRSCAWASGSFSAIRFIGASTPARVRHHRGVISRRHLYTRLSLYVARWADPVAKSGNTGSGSVAARKPTVCAPDDGRAQSDDVEDNCWSFRHAGLC